MILNKEQNYVVEEAVKQFRAGNEQVFQLAGYAGTGKSVVLFAILERLQLPLYKVAPMAYIGQAAIVMRTKGLMNAKTIHSWLFKPIDKFKVDKSGDIIMNNYYNKPETMLGFEPKEIDSNIELMIIDEAGSVPENLKYHIESRNIPIIAAGDLGQLPPVYGKPAYLQSGKIHTLNQIMRQSANSGLIYLADRARQGLPIHEGFYGDVLVINEDDLMDDMLLNSDIVICAKNKTRDIINKRVRHDILNIRQDIPVYGEKLVCRKNNWNVEVDGINLANGLIGNVVNSPGVETFDGKMFNIDFKPNMINSCFKSIPCDYNYMIAPHEKKQFLKNSKYNRGEKFEYAYAITCHLSQGGQFNNGIYIEEFMGADIQNNLNYTGITRFSNSLIYVKHKRRYY